MIQEPQSTTGMALIKDVSQAADAELRRRYGRRLKFITLVSSVWFGFSIVLLAMTVWRSIIQGSEPINETFLSLVFSSFVPFAIYGAFHTSIKTKLVPVFWRQFAATLNWKYHGRGSPDHEPAVLTQLGHNRKIDHRLHGSLAGKPARVFYYSHDFGGGNNSRTIAYTVWAIRFAGAFPHLYLNYLHNWNHEGFGNPAERVALPSEFEKRFHLYAPKKYEIEALQIFTPDVLVYLLDQNFRCDIELVDHELLIFVSPPIESTKRFKEEFEKISQLVTLLASRLDTISYTAMPIKNRIFVSRKIVLKFLLMSVAYLIFMYFLFRDIWNWLQKLYL